MSWFSDGLAAGAVRLAAAAGELVTIHRGPQSTAGVTAMWGRPESDALETEGLALAINSREWTIQKAAYAFGGVAREPQHGDRIVDADGTWQVLPDDGKPAWASSGDDWQIRTKLVKA